MPDTDVPRTEYDAAFKAGVMSARHTLVEKIPVVLHPADWSVESLEQYLPAPTRRRGTVNFAAVESFCRYVAEFKIKFQARIFAEKRGNGCLRAILDFHDAKGEPSWCEDIAVLTLAQSPEWKTWTGLAGKAMTQQQFAEFLEDNYQDIIEPAAADVLQSALTLEAKKTVHFKSGTRLDNGTHQFVYEESIDSNKGQGKVVIPSAFTLLLPVFEHTALVRLEARLRYKIQNEGLTFTYVLNTPHRVVDAAFEGLLAQVEEATGIKPYISG
jgi:uncharacterized protein YfdQ (DUF2303 family)